MTASMIFPAISLTSNLDAGLNFTSGVSAGCSAAAADLAPDFDRAGGSAGAACGVAEVLRPRAGLLAAGATTTSSVGSAFAAEGGRFAMGPAPTLGVGAGAGVGPDATPDELDAAPLVREALLLLPLGAAGATISGTDCLPIIAPFIDRPFPVDFGATISGTGAGSSFGADFAFFSRWAFRLVSSDALTFAWSGFANLPLFS